MATLSAPSSARRAAPAPPNLRHTATTAGATVTRSGWRLNPEEDPIPPHEVIGARLRPPRVRAIARDRVDGLLDRVWDHRMTLVVAPAGAGKTTALAQFAGRSPHPVAWYRAEAADGSVASLLAHLRRAFTDALGELTGPWDSPGAVAAALEEWPGERAVLVIDDLHALRGTPAEAVVERLVDYLPQHVSTAVASRTAPGFDLSRLRLGGELHELMADDLRFRTWEAEQLFRDLYGTLLAPEDLARLTRRVEGWAAGLQLFHLAARSKPPAEQRRLIDLVSSRSRLAREYLTRNVLDELPPDLRSFLIDTCVLGVVTPALADALLGRTDSAQLLGDLEALQLFTIPLDDEGTYRYHEVLRSHLEVLLTERDGEEAVRQRHATAGCLLERSGFVAEALRCFGRSGDQEGVRRLGGDGAQALGSLRWLDSMPAAIVEADPWLLLARARHAARGGRIREALAAYGAAERLFGDAGPTARCREERLDLQGWLDPLAPPRAGWAAAVRAGARRDPLAHADRLVTSDAPGDLVAAAALRLFAGALPEARAAAERALLHPQLTVTEAAAARLVAAVTELLSPDGELAAEPVDDAEADAEEAGCGWLARMARAALALTDRRAGVVEAGRVTALCDADGDPWGAALAGLAEGLGSLGQDEPHVAALRDAAHRWHVLEAPVLEAVALGGLAVALARAGDASAASVATAAAHLGRTTGSAGAEAMALAALAAVDPGRRTAHLNVAHDLRVLGGFALPPLVPAVVHRATNATPSASPAPPAGGPGAAAASPAPHSNSADAAATVESADGAATAESVDGAAVAKSGPDAITADAADGDAADAEASLAATCFGPFAVRLGGQPLDLSSLRPRARAALRLLALHAGRAVHREVLVDALWRDSEPEAGLRGLQVAVSSARQVLGGAARLVREGDAYRLVATSDVHAFDQAVDAAAAARARGDVDIAARQAERALALHRGDLLAEEGPAEWVVSARDKCRMHAAAMAALVAEVALERGDATAAASACERGLHVDRFSDGLWRLLAEALERAGDRAAAARARQAYEDVMRELGVTS